MAEKPHILQEGSTFPFLLLNVAEMYAEVAQSILIFFFLCEFGLRIFLEG